MDFAARLCFAIGIWAAFWVSAGVADEAVAPQKIDFFENEVRPLLVKHCHECHGEADNHEGGLLLTSRDSILGGGESGPAAVPGKPDESLLIDAVRQHGLVMPPTGKLPDEDVNKLVLWVAQGMPWPDAKPGVVGNSQRSTFAITDAQRDHWAFQPLAHVSPPQVKNEAWSPSAIDRIVMAKLDSAGLQPNGPAAKHTLLRRVTFDLTGLPPTPDELHAFIANNSPEALTQVIDRLLASPRYGERWGRHWLDVVRYADTTGENSDFPVPQAFLYRDYVIDAFNSDKPYDEFIREQIAGDILADEGSPEKYRERRIATGYLAIARRFGFNRDYYQHLTIADTIDTMGRSILGFSIGCARCHDHKFDPISAHDYYALYGIFSSSAYAFSGAEHMPRPVDLVPLVPPNELEPLKAAHESDLAMLDAEIKRLGEEQGAINARITAMAPVAGGAPAMTERESQLAELKAQLAKAQQAAAKLAVDREALLYCPPYDVAYSVVEGTPGNARVQLKGDQFRLGAEVPRRWLELFGGERVAADAGSGRRQLADWLTSPANPLTARVMVNRIWHYHFGKGLVQTTNDFGMRGKPPTHPELLDYLATRFIENGWSIKALHREILLSRTYQMSSDAEGPGLSTDVENDLLWRTTPRRLDAEAIRDALLAVSGELDDSCGGKHPFPAVHTWRFSQHKPFKAVYESRRRSVYLMTPRFERHPFLALFDGADPNTSTGERLFTITPAQALFFMNDPFLHAQSSALAKRVTAARSEDARRLELLYELAYARLPTAAEIASSRDFLDRYAERLGAVGVREEEQELTSWGALARVVLGSNEFLYVY